MRTACRDVELYAPDRRPVAVNLSDNTNRWGAPPAASRTLADTSVSAARYPEAYSAPLKAALADYVGVDPSMIVVGAGSDGVLDAAIRAFGEPGELLCLPWPSFEMIPTFGRVNGLRVEQIMFTETGDIDERALAAANPSITYLCSPNNPTGGLIPRATIERVIENSRGLVIVDEAYVEFSGVSVIDLVSHSPRLLVARTLSKAFGLAGLRVGYGVAQASVVRQVEKSRGPYTVSGPAERAATAAVWEDRAWVREQAALATTNRDRLIGELRERGASPLPSAANFVLVPESAAVAIARHMRDAGVAVRAFAGLNYPDPSLQATGGNALRLSVGPWSEMTTLLDAFDEARAACA